MKIFVVGPEIGDHFEKNVAFTFRKMGHDVVSFGRRSGARGKWLEPAVTRGLRLRLRDLGGLPKEERLAIKVAQEARPQLTVVLTNTLEPEAVAEIRRVARGPVVCWYGDPVANLTRGHVLSGEYDAVFVKDPDFAVAGRDLFGVETFHLDEACNPIWHKPVADCRNGTLVFAGTLYNLRARMVERLLSVGEDVTVYGPSPSGWVPKLVKMAHAGVFLDETNKAATFGEGLGCVNTFAPAEGRNSLNCRIFETCGCGALLLSERREAIRRCFEPGREFLEFSSFEELREIAGSLRRDYEWAREIRRAAAKRALCEHTYERRLEEMLRIIGL